MLNKFEENGDNSMDIFHFGVIKLKYGNNVQYLQILMDRLKEEGWGRQEEEIPQSAEDLKKMTKKELRVVFDTVDADKSGEVSKRVRKILQTIFYFLIICYRK